MTKAAIHCMMLSFKWTERGGGLDQLLIGQREMLAEKDDREGERRAAGAVDEGLSSRASILGRPIVPAQAYRVRRGERGGVSNLSKA